MLVMATRRCDWCGNEYSRPPSLLRKHCSRECGGLGRTKSLDSITSRRRKYCPGHPLADDAGYAPQHRMILYDAIGGGTHPCHWCGKPVTWVKHVGPISGSLVVDHVDNDWRNNSRHNLVPSCQPCNGNRTHRVRDDEVFIIRKNGTRLRGVARECLHCGKPFVATPSDVKAGKGKYCSRACGASKATSQAPA